MANVERPFSGWRLTPAAAGRPPRLLEGVEHEHELGSAFEVFWFFAFFEPPGRKNAPGGSKGAPNPKPGSPDAGRNLAKNAKKLKTSFLRPSKARPCFNTFDFHRGAQRGGALT